MRSRKSWRFRRKTCRPRSDCFSTPAGAWPIKWTPRDRPWGIFCKNRILAMNSLISFNNHAEMDSRFTSDIDLLQRRTASLKPEGRTSLLDAIYYGLEQMKSARNERRILMVLSDGGDNHSRHHEGEIRALLQEADCQLYALGIFDAKDMMRTTEERNGPGLLSQLAEMTGGHLFQTQNLRELTDLSGRIGTELRSQYVLGYKPSDAHHDGRWRKIKVSVTPPSDRPPLAARARTGYYSPRD